MNQVFTGRSWRDSPILEEHATDFNATGSGRKSPQTTRIASPPRNCERNRGPDDAIAIEPAIQGDSFVEQKPGDVLACVHHAAATIEAYA